MAGLTWKNPPRTLGEKLGELTDRKLLYAMEAVLGRRATLMANDALRNAPWQDRTGNARSGLFGTSEVNERRGSVFIFLSHGVPIDYGKYLELANSGRYSIIMRTIEQHGDAAMRDLADVFND